MDKVQAIYDDVKSTAEEFPTQPDLRDSQARIAFNMAIDYIKQNRIDAVIEICDELKELGQAHPDEGNIDRERVRILANLVFHYIDDNATDLPKAREAYQAIVEVSNRRPDDTYIRKLQADTAVSIIATIDDLHEANC
jgi:CCR4-NOT transcriptional regulation complex NOT5 subunit